MTNGKLKPATPLDRRSAPYPWETPLWDAAAPPTILVLDQVSVNRRLLRAMLKSEPYRILEAERAPDALAILANEKVDLVIMDLMMPGMSGPELCRMIKADRRTHWIPVLMMTNVHGVENEIAGIASGRDEFLTKPLHPEVVRTRIRSMLRNKAAIDSLEEASRSYLPWRNRSSFVTTTLAATASGLRGTASRSARRWDCHAPNCSPSTAAGFSTISAKSPFPTSSCASPAV
jgi:CheY-like chemotaxis protein